MSAAPEVGTLAARLATAAFLRSSCARATLWLCSKSSVAISIRPTSGGSRRLVPFNDIPGSAIDDFHPAPSFRRSLPRGLPSVENTVVLKKGRSSGRTNHANLKHRPRLPAPDALAQLGTEGDGDRPPACAVTTPPARAAPGAPHRPIRRPGGSPPADYSPPS